MYKMVTHQFNRSCIKMIQCISLNMSWLANNLTKAKFKQVLCQWAAHWITINITTKIVARLGLMSSLISSTTAAIDDMEGEM